MAPFWSRRKPAPVAPLAEEPTQGDLQRWALMLQEEGRLHGIEGELAAALQTWPAHGDLLMLQGRLLRLKGAHGDALQVLEAALIEASHPGEVHTEIALCHLNVHRMADALDSLEVAVTLQPELGLSWLQLGEVLVRFDRFVEARDAFERAAMTADKEPLKAQALLRWGQVASKAGKPEQAKQAFTDCLHVQPDHLDALVGLGHAELWLDEEPNAATHLGQALDRIERAPKEILVNYGAALQCCGRYEEARRIYTRVVSEHPNDFVSQWYLCQLDLALCRWRDGWARYGSRFTSRAIPYRPMPFRRWDGTAQPDATLLILADEGLGDEIMYSSCLTEAAARVGKVIVECEPRLHPLFSRSFPGMKFIATRRENSVSWLEGLPVPDWQIPSSDLPALFRPCDDAFPKHEGYLLADPQRVLYWKQRLANDLGPGLKVGLSWRGGTVRTRARARSLDPALLAPLLAIEGVSFVNLQYGDYREDLDALNALTPDGARLHDFPETNASYDDTAALVCALDMVVTVCTAVVHLAGALNVPTWILTPLAPGWRYTAHRSSMPWYPSTRLFRQESWGEWHQPCQKLAAELRQLTIHGSNEQRKRANSPE